MTIHSTLELLARLGVLPPEAWDFIIPHIPYGVRESLAIQASPEPQPWRLAAIDLVEAAAFDRTIARLPEGTTKRDLTLAHEKRAESAITILVNTIPNPDDSKEPHGPGTPHLRVASVLLILANAMPNGPTRSTVIAKAKTLI